MPNPSTMIVLVEDERHEMLVRRYLRRCGMEHHQIRLERSPSGEGSAEQWVRARFAKEVSAYRNRRARAATALIVVVDADNYAVEDRLAQLAQSLIDAGVAPVYNEEKIARLTPKRNVETWILSLSAEVVDEVTEYKETRNDWNALIPGASHVLFQWTRRNAVPASCIGSLAIGIRELKRLQI